MRIHEYEKVQNELLDVEILKWLIQDIQFDIVDGAILFQ